MPSAQRVLFHFIFMILLGSQDYYHLHLPGLETGSPERFGSLPKIPQLAGGGVWSEMCLTQRERGGIRGGSGEGILHHTLVSLSYCGPTCCPGRPACGRGGALPSLGWPLPRTPCDGTFQDSMTCAGGSRWSPDPQPRSRGLFEVGAPRTPGPPWPWLQLREGSGGSYARASRGQLAPFSAC